jgi:peptidoglycan/LPS O-acetylase OafA/YrhL
LPVVVQVLALLVGVAGMFANARGFATHMARHAGADDPLRQAMTLHTWLIGMGISVLLSILYLAISPADVPTADQNAIVAAGTAILVFAPMAHIFSRAVADVPLEPLRLPRVPVPAIVVLVLLVGGNIALSVGVRFG